MEFLLQNSKDVNLKVRIRLKCPTLIFRQDKYGFTVLHHAVYRGNWLAVDKLMGVHDLQSKVRRGNHVIICGFCSKQP